MDFGHVYLGDEVFIAAENDHYQEVANKKDVHEFEHRDHHELRGEGFEMGDHVPEFLKELQADDWKRQDKTDKNDPTVCSKCGTEYYFKNTITVYKR